MNIDCRYVIHLQEPNMYIKNHMQSPILPIHMKINFKNLYQTIYNTTTMIVFFISAIFIH
jgi:hypothetical protein